MPFDYDRSYIQRQEHGSLPGAHNCTVNAGFGWNWKGRERATGRVRTYFTRGSYGNKQELIDHIEAHFHGIEFLDGAEADREPMLVMPLPPHSFQHGIMDVVAKEIVPATIARSILRTLSPIPRTRITPARR